MHCVLRWVKSSAHKTCVAVNIRAGRLLAGSLCTERSAFPSQSHLCSWSRFFPLSWFPLLNSRSPRSPIWVTVSSYKILTFLHAESILQFYSTPYMWLQTQPSTLDTVRGLACFKMFAIMVIIQAVQLCNCETIFAPSTNKNGLII